MLSSFSLRRDMNVRARVLRNEAMLSCFCEDKGRCLSMYHTNSTTVCECISSSKRVFVCARARVCVCLSLEREKEREGEREREKE